MPKLDLGGILQVAHWLLHFAGVVNGLSHGSDQALSCASSESSELRHLMRPW